MKPVTLPLVKLFSLLFALLISPLVAAPDGYIQQWFKAEDFKKSGDKEAELEARLRCFELAIEAKDGNYGYPAASSCTFLLYNQGRQVEAGKLAQDILKKLSSLPNKHSFQAKVCRCEVFMVLDRGLQAEGRIGEGWRVNGAVAETLRGKHPGPDDGGEALTVREVLHLPKNLRAIGWRSLTREAEYLDLAGRPQEALRLLAEADTILRSQWKRLHGNEKFYAFKIRNAYSAQLDFLGYAKKALDLEEELLALSADDSVTGTYLTLKINHFRNLSQWEGPSEEILENARQTAKELIKLGPINAIGVERLLAKMELDLRASKTALSTLADAVAKNESADEWFEATYASRDSMIARSRNGEEIPDADFHAILKKMRAQGNKRGEPTIYAEFANHLIRTDRSTEAIPLYREALRLIRSFGRDFHEIPILCRLLKVQLDSGDPAAVQTALDELNAAIARIRDLPSERLVLAAIPRAQALLALGREKEARHIIAQAETAGRDLPDHRLTAISKEVIAALFGNPISLASSSADIPALIQIQPESVTTLAIPGEPTSARFTLINKSSTSSTSELVASGPGAEIRNHQIYFDPGKPRQQARLHVELSAGREKPVEIKTTAAASNSTLNAQIQWKDSYSFGTWEVNWDPAAKNSVVLDASQLKGDPFQSITFAHHVQLPAGIENAAFRLVSPEPLRVEYYDSRSSQLIAIDANGNGDFSEEGDIHLRGPDGTAAAWITPETGPSLELRIFGTITDGPVSFSGPITLKAEVLRSGVWTLEAEDILR